MQHVAVDMVSSKMFERTGQRLGDLNRQTGGWIIGQTMVLATLIGEFCLQKQIAAGYETRAISRRQTLPTPASR